MSRVYVNFIDHDEIMELRKTEHERPIGRTEEGEDILSYLGTVVQQYVGLAGQPSPEDIEKPPQIIGISKSIEDEKENWTISRPFFPEWIKSRSELNFEIPGCTREFVAGQDEQWSWRSFYAESNCYAVTNLRLINDGRMLKELTDAELSNLFAEVDMASFRMDPEGSIGDPNLEVDEDREVIFDDLCFCINCECLIHVDDVGNGICGECGCGEPESPVYEDESRWENIFEEFF